MMQSIFSKTWLLKIPSMDGDISSMDEEMSSIDGEMSSMVDIHRLRRRMTDMDGANTLQHTHSDLGNYEEIQISW